ncbi:MAG: glycolate oxidase subunit GlcD [Candidatus Rokubacteria bacterium RIFCSPLOWO2_12_FULL_71_19]|nr:MAG: glycolate oxidase subunit GlcD [Candidatus Rokubacteria bacterium RIFCSPLOWO2_12_FULL_71_19]
MDAGLIAALEGIVGRAGVVATPEGRLTYECDMHTFYKGAPDVVVLPTSAAQTAAVVRLCREKRVPLIPRGSGTGLIGGAMAPRGGVMVSMTRMNRILEVDIPNRCATVEPGLINLWLSDATRARGYFFAPDPSSQMVSSIGGNASTNAGGPHCLKYGITVNHVLGLQMATGAGELVWVGGKAQARPGYDLPGVMVGAEGTFGVVTAVMVRLFHLPEGVKTLLASFSSIEDASETVSAIIAEGIIPAALEMLDEVMIRAIEEGIHAGYPKGASAVLLIELDGPRAEIEAQARRIEEICRAHLALELRVAQSEPERALLWKGRKEAAGVIGRLTPNWLLQDAVVPRSRLPEIMREMLAISARHRLVFANVFHAGDGNLHPIICYDDRVPGELERAKQANEALMHACLAMGGSVTGEHGVGLDKAEKLPYQFAEADLNFMARLRRVFDPDTLMNPGKLLPDHPACAEGFRPASSALPGGSWV